MPFQSPTRVMETSTTTGTGSMTLAGAVVGLRTFAAELAAGAFLEYNIAEVDASGADTGVFEYGVGKMTSTTVLQRLAPIAGSSATPISFAAGTKRIMVTLLGTTAVTLTQWFGDGSDGDVTVTTTITLTRDVYYNNLTMGAAGIINTANFRIFVAGVLLDVGNVAGAIRNDGNAGTVGGVATGGAAGATVAFGSLSGHNSATAGGNGTATAGTQSPAPAAPQNGGLTGASGKGGTSGANAGGASRAATAAASVHPVRRLTTEMRANLPITAGGGSPGGGGGAGDGTNSGTGGGGGGVGGGIVWLAARIISTTGTTPVGFIRASGGAGADARQTAPAGNAAGGGGAGGAGGGWVYLIYQARIGAAVTGLVAVDGGTGGLGGPGLGTGKGGDGGQGADCGRVTLINMMTGITEPVAPTGTAGTVPTAATTTAGTAGTAGVTGRATF